MRTVPNFAGAKPRKWFWLVRLVPCVQFNANGFYVGFMWVRGGEWHPRMKGWRIRYNVSGYWVKPHKWSTPKIKLEKAL